MKVEITGSAKEIAALALELQKRQPLNALLLRRDWNCSTSLRPIYSKRPV